MTRMQKHIICCWIIKRKKIIQLIWSFSQNSCEQKHVFILFKKKKEPNSNESHGITIFIDYNTGNMKNIIFDEIW